MTNKPLHDEAHKLVLDARTYRDQCLKCDPSDSDSKRLMALVKEVRRQLWKAQTILDRTWNEGKI